MKIKQVLFFVYCICVALKLHAQKNIVAVKLDSFSISISKVRHFSKGFTKRIISDTLVSRNPKTLTEILRFNSFIYFRENGLGMVSSPSFRGTNASQTAVIWNGININSQLNGQTDFNAISANSYNDIAVRSGGGSVLFGSGAIGGTVHLNNAIVFKKAQKHKLLAEFGSFNTSHTSYSFVKSTDKKYVNIGVGFNNSDNNFKYLESSLTNENGSFYNYNVDVNVGYKINRNHQLKFYSNSFFANRNLSRTLTAPSNDLYKDSSLKNLAEWDYFISNSQIITSRIAYIFDEFRFFDNNKKLDVFSIGTSKRKIFQLDYNHTISRKIKINTIFGFENSLASGTSFSTATRSIFSGVFSLNHQLSKKLSYGIQFRKDIQNDFDAPFLYSLGIEQKWHQNYTLTFNTSKNFRVPTFNDLYWQPGGNSSLKPENSYQFEIGNSFNFKHIGFKINGFYIKSTDLIQWIPNNLGFWSPENVMNTRNMGVEFSANYKKIFNHHILECKTTYSFTDAKDLQTDNQLIAVPKNRATLLINYQYKDVSVFYQLLANDNVTFLVDTIPAFSVSNLGFNYQLSAIKNKPTIGFKINNIFNNNYQNTLNRPMPGINYLVTTNINI